MELIAAAWKYSAKLTTKINESTMHGRKRAYLEARGRKDDSDNLTTKETRQTIVT